MDRFTKVVLAVIAFALCAIAAKLWQPAEAHAQPFVAQAPTVGEFQDARDDEAKRRLLRRIPIVRVHGG